MSKQQSVWGAKRMFGGFIGLKFTADKIAKYIPKVKCYVEPFAGMARVAKLITSDEIVLNDKSDYVVNTLPILFPNAIITQEDFSICIKKWDSDSTFQLIDPVWRRSCYEVNDMTVCDRTPYEYFVKVLELVKDLKSDWIICSNVDEHEIKKVLSKTAKERGYHSIIVSSDKKVIFGKYARTLLVSNKPFLEQMTKKGKRS